MKRIISSVLLGVLLLTLVAVPVLAAYYAYLTVEEEDGNAYEELAVICSRNITQLVDYDLMTSTGLDSRVLTGSAEALPHMLSEDKILFVTDLAAYEEKTLIFYLGATSLSSFPIVLGHDGYLTTPDHADLELTYVMELLAAGYFDAATGADKNILYKEDAYRVYISDTNEITVAGLSAGDVEEWTMTYGSFTTGVHTVYILSNGLGAYLYVDDFVTPKDTQNLFEYNSAVLHSGYTDYGSWYRRTFYTQDKYWVFYDKNDSKVYYKTSADGLSWSGEYEIATPDTSLSYATVTLRGTYVHVTYADDVSDTMKYRRGVPEGNSTITWSAAWQTAATIGDGYNAMRVAVAADTDNYPLIVYQRMSPIYNYDTYISKSSTNDGTWSTEGGYPLTLVTGVSYGDGCAITDFPDSDKMYALYRPSNQLIGRYYNGTSWAGSSEVIYTGGSTTEANCVADDDDNVYIVGHDGNGETVYFRIRYANGSFSDTVEIADEVTYASGISVSYNTDNDYIYITYIRGNYARCVTYNQGELTGEYTLFTSSNLYQMSAAAYGSHIGMVYREYDLGQTGHAYLQFPWTWNDNANNWMWMENNVMPYASDLVMGIDGILVLEYEPDSIILGTVMPDESGSSHPATITWGSNPLGVTTSLTAFVDEDEAGPPLEGTVPGLTPPPDMVGPTGQPGWTADIPSLVSHPLYPAVNVISDVTGIPAKLIWILGATLLVAAAMLVCFRYAPHQLITVFVGGGLSAFFYSMDIYPFWVIFIFAVMGIAVIIGERSPTVS